MQLHNASWLLWAVRALGARTCATPAPSLSLVVAVGARLAPHAPMCTSSFVSVLVCRPYLNFNISFATSTGCHETRFQNRSLSLLPNFSVGVACRPLFTSCSAGQYHPSTCIISRAWMCRLQSGPLVTSVAFVCSVINVHHRSSQQGALQCSGASCAPYPFLQVPGHRNWCQQLPHTKAVIFCSVVSYYQ